MPRTPGYMKAYARLRSAALRERFAPHGVCSVCGSSEDLVWDHVDPTMKSHNIGSMIASCYAEAKIKAELLKCRVLCRSCNSSIARRRKLSREQVQEIKAAGGTHFSIAQKYNVAPSTVTRIKNGRRRTCPE